MDMYNDILAYFLDNGDNEFTGYAIAKALKRDYRVINKYLNELVDKKVLSKTEQGSGYLYKFLYAYDSVVVNAEMYRRDIATKNKEIMGINSYIKSVKSSLFVCLLFGSRVIGKQTKTSDYDICIIAEKDVQEEVERALSILPFKLHIVAFTEEEFKSMIRKKEFNVGNEIIKKHIIFHGIESFYWMMQK